MKKITVRYERNKIIYKFRIECADKQELKQALEFVNEYYFDKMQGIVFFSVSVD